MCRKHFNYSLKHQVNLHFLYSEEDALLVSSQRQVHVDAAQAGVEQLLGVGVDQRHANSLVQRHVDVQPRLLLRLLPGVPPDQVPALLARAHRLLQQLLRLRPLLPAELKRF